MEVTDGGKAGEQPMLIETSPSWAGRLAAWDVALMRRLTSFPLPKAVTIPLVFLVRVGDGWMWFLVAFYLWRTFPYSQLKHAVIHCFLAIAVSLAVYWPVKLLVRRQRPFVFDPGVTAKVPPLDKYSFPSGHTMNNLAVALTLAIYLPRVLPIALGLPLVLGGLRILFGVHFFTDIAGGAVLGAASYEIAKIIFPLTPF